MGLYNVFPGVAATHGGTVDSFTAPQVVKMREFQDIVRGILELQQVDLDLLHSNTSKVCFFMNVLNLLLAHASLVQCGRLVAEVDQEEGMFKLFQFYYLSRFVNLKKLCMSC